MLASSAHRPEPRRRAVADQLADEAKVYCRRQLAQEMVWEDAGILRDEVFVDHPEEAALAAVFSRPSALPLSATVRNYSAIIPPPVCKVKGVLQQSP